MIVSVSVGMTVTVTVIVMLSCKCYRLLITKYLSKQYPSFYSSSALLLLN